MPAECPVEFNAKSSILLDTWMMFHYSESLKHMKIYTEQKTPHTVCSSCVKHSVLPEALFITITQHGK